MNAIEMAMQAMIGNALKNLPPEVIGTIGQIGETVKGFKAQLDRIEARMIRIENALLPLEKIDDGRNDAGESAADVEPS
jgi:hypothetical protein